MTKQNLLKTIIKEKDHHETYPKASNQDIEQTEEAINCKLPKSYCDLVTEFSNGAYLYMLQEISAVGEGNQQILPIQKLSIRQMIYTETDEVIPIREGGTVKLDHLIPFSLDHNGNAWCFIVNQMSDQEYKVGYFDSHNPKLYGVMNDFNEWLHVLITNKEEVIRALYDDRILVDELGLG